MYVRSRGPRAESAVPVRSRDEDSHEKPKKSNTRPKFLLLVAGILVAYVLFRHASTPSSSSVVSSTSLLKKGENAPRIFCMVPTQINPHRRRLMDAILDTWGPDCDTLAFFVDPPAADESDFPTEVVSSDGFARAEVVVVPMVRTEAGLCSDGKPCRHIWEKVWRSWVYVAEHSSMVDGHDYFCKIDDDSYFIVDNLRKFVVEKGWRPSEHRYFGTSSTTAILRVLRSFRAF